MTTKKENKGDKGDNSFNILKSIRDIVFVLGIYLFFSGWIYIYYYLNYFGISIRDVNIDFSQFAVYSYSVLSFYYFNYFTLWREIILLILLLVIIITFSKYGKYVFYKLSFQLTIIILFIFLFPALFYFSKKAGYDTAMRQLNYNESALKPVKFIFKDSYLNPDTTGSNNSTFKEKYNYDYLNEKMQLAWLNYEEKIRLIISNEREYFILYQNQKDFTIHPEVYSVKKEDIQNIKIELKNDIIKY